MLQSKLEKTPKTSNKFWNILVTCNASLKKQVGLYEVESIDNPNMITIAVNPKKYFEKFRNKQVNINE